MDRAPGFEPEDVSSNLAKGTMEKRQWFAFLFIYVMTYTIGAIWFVIVDLFNLQNMY